MTNFTVKKVAVLGAGVMGAQIAAHCVNAKVPVVLFDLPGCDPASINLTVERNLLTVHAERSRPSDDVELLIGERPTGTFSRQLFLAETLDTERMVANYTDGVLRLRVPVKEQAKPRRVDIAVGDGQSTSIETTARDATPEPVSTGVS